MIIKTKNPDIQFIEYYKVVVEPTNRAQIRKFEREVKKVQDTLLRIELSFIENFFNPDSACEFFYYEHLFNSAVNRLNKHGKLVFIMVDINYFHNNYNPDLANKKLDNWATKEYQL